MTKDDLIAFEADVAAVFERGEIRAPIHLSGGNEEQLLRIFQDIRPGDWVISTWRSHYHALLHGVPPSKVMGAICAGRSISLCFPGCRFLASGIVSGAVPIALGIALGLKRIRDEKISGWGKVEYVALYSAPTGGEKLTDYVTDAGAQVWCFVGDMCARTGAFHEARQYAIGHDLPITFVIEDNGKSVLTYTNKSWGNKIPFIHHIPSLWQCLGDDMFSCYEMKTIVYYYELNWPHSGTGKRVRFSF